MRSLGHLWVLHYALLCLVWLGTEILYEQNTHVHMFAGTYLRVENLFLESHKIPGSPKDENPQPIKITVVDYWWTFCLRKWKRTTHSHLILLVRSHLHASRVYNTPYFTWLFYHLHLSIIWPSCLCRTKERFRKSRCTMGGNRTTNEWTFSSTQVSNLAFFHSEFLARVRVSLNSNRQWVVVPMMFVPL